MRLEFTYSNDDYVEAHAPQYESADVAKARRQRRVGWIFWLVFGFVAITAIALTMSAATQGLFVADVSVGLSTLFLTAIVPAIWVTTYGLQWTIATYRQSASAKRSSHRTNQIMGTICAGMLGLGLAVMMLTLDRESFGTIFFVAATPWALASIVFSVASGEFASRTFVQSRNSTLRCDSPKFVNWMMNGS